MVGDLSLLNKFSFVILYLRDEMFDEFHPRCRVVIEGGRLERGTRVQIMPDIVTIGNTKLTIKEGENFTLKCDVLPGT